MRGHLAEPSPKGHFQGATHSDGASRKPHKGGIICNVEPHNLWVIRRASRLERGIPKTLIKGASTICGHPQPHTLGHPSSSCRGHCSSLNLPSNFLRLSLLFLDDVSCDVFGGDVRLLVFDDSELSMSIAQTPHLRNLYDFPCNSKKSVPIG